MSELHLAYVSKWETIHTEMCSVHMFIFMQTKLIFIWRFCTKNSFWNRDKRNSWMADSVLVSKRSLMGTSSF